MAQNVSNFTHPHIHANTHTHTRAQSIQALSEHTVSFSHLLALPGSSHLLDLLLSLPREGGGDRGFTAQCKLVENLLAHYFRLLGAGAAILVESECLIPPTQLHYYVLLFHM